MTQILTRNELLQRDLFEYMHNDIKTYFECIYKKWYCHANWMKFNIEKTLNQLDKLDRIVNNKHYKPKI